MLDIANKNIFITGATGFIGEKLAFKLAEKNQVFALIRPQSEAKAKRLKEKSIRIIFGDLLDAYSYSEQLNSVDYVFHLAALFKIEASKGELYKYNVLGTKVMLEACLGRNIKKIIYFSTAYVAGKKEKDFMTEEEPAPKSFKNWYEWSKLESEKIVLALYKKHSLPVVIARPVVVCGPGSFYGFYNAVSLVAKGKLWALPGNGRNRVHLVHVDDVVNAAIHLAGLNDNNGEIYHICDNHVLTCAKIIKLISGQTGKKYPLITIPRWLAKFSSRLPIWKILFPDISEELLDYFLYNQTYSGAKLKSTGFSFAEPSLRDKLNSTINWYRENVSI